MKYTTQHLKAAIKATYNSTPHLLSGRSLKAYLKAYYAANPDDVLAKDFDTSGATAYITAAEAFRWLKSVTPIVREDIMDQEFFLGWFESDCHDDEANGCLDADGEYVSTPCIEADDDDECLEMDLNDVARHGLLMVNFTL